MMSSLSKFRRGGAPSLLHRDPATAAVFTCVLFGDVAALTDELRVTGKSVNSELDENGKTALHFAVMYGKVDMVEWLISEGADVNRQDKKQQTPLHMVYPEINYFNVRLPMLACRTDPRTNEIVRGTIVAILLRNGADLSVQDYKGCTPLHIALSQCSVTLTESLVRAGANVTVHNRDGLTALHIARAFGFLDRVLDSYGDLDAQDSNGDTLLHRILSPESIFYVPEVVRQLLQRGATVDIRNNSNQTPYGYSQMEQCDCVEGFDFPNGRRCINMHYNLHLKTKQELVKHIVMLKTAGIHVHDDVSAEFLNCRLSEPGALLEWRSCCHQEMETIKKREITRGITLDYVFTRNPRKPYYLEDQTLYANLNEILQTPDLERHFPIYASTLRQVFEKSKKRFCLIREATQSLATETRVHLLQNLATVQLAVERLFDYLNDKDLENLIKSA